MPRVPIRSITPPGPSGPPQSLRMLHGALRLPGAARNIAQLVSGQPLPGGEFTDVLGGGADALGIVLSLTDPRLSDTRKALGVARGATGLLSNRPVQALFPALRSLNAPIPGTNMPGLSTASSLLGVGLGALDIAEGRPGQGVASLVPSLTTLAINALEAGAGAGALTFHFVFNNLVVDNEMRHRELVRDIQRVLQENARRGIGI